VGEAGKKTRDRAIVGNFKGFSLYQLEDWIGIFLRFNMT
jgi:hypothetical protein